MNRKFYHKLTCTPAVAGFLLCGRYVRNAANDDGHGQFTWGATSSPASTTLNDPHKTTITLPDATVLTLSVGSPVTDSVTFDPRDPTLVWPITWKGFTVGLGACPVAVGNEPIANFNPSTNTFAEAHLIDSTSLTTVISGSGTDPDAAPGVEWQDFSIKVVGLEGVIADLGTVTGTPIDAVVSTFSFNVTGATLEWHNKKFVVTATDFDGNTHEVSRTIKLDVRDPLMTIPSHPSNAAPSPAVTEANPPTLTAPVGETWDADTANGGTTWVNVAPTALKGGLILRNVVKVIEYTVTATDVPPASLEDTARLSFQGLRRLATSRIQVEGFLNGVSDGVIDFDGPLLPAAITQSTDTPESYDIIAVEANDVIRWEIRGLDTGGSIADADLPFLTHTNLQFV